MLWGIDRLSGGQLSGLRRRLRGSEVGVLTHGAAVDRRGRNVLRSLEELGIEARVVFTPEHGFDGALQAEEAVPSPEREDGAATAPVVSLYGHDAESLSPKAEALEGLGVLVIDLADVGSRYYTYVWTALLVARAARARGVHVVVLDRPNPIGGDAALAEGAPQKEGFLSFVGLEPIPTRHGLTIGELLAYFFERDGVPLGPDGALSVVPVLGWERHRTAAAWDRPFVMPSPNMPTAETALVYPGGCLVEGTNLSEGRGTTAPFQIVGAPFLRSDDLAQAMRDAILPGVLVRPVSFRPTFEKHAGKDCHGVMLHVTDPASFRPLTTYLTLLALVRAQAPDAFAFRNTPYEFEHTRPAFDLLTGSPEAREALLAGASASALIDLVTPVPPEWRQEVERAEARVLNGAHA
ncbi:MAG TPA: DUF1343 domain-containing protein [Polyangiaceae bacterium]|jgi:uncharacterized protein YbbC (DUF1343 family)|nr:DUF1343 domain-containing protein [Polyangiaceae bacterium]